jgi:lysozyme family protein
MIKDKIINNIIDIEGGYVNDPHDSGGETNFGITVKVARQNGYLGSMKDMPRHIAYNIYSRIYWDSMLLDNIINISDKITEELVDTGINMGVHKSSIFLQRSLNALNHECYFDDLIVDGKIGEKTIRALEIFINVRGFEGESILLKSLNCLQGNFYLELTEKRRKDKKFFFGWIKNRVKID